MINNKNIPFQAIDWIAIQKVEYTGEKGIAFWQTIQFPGLRIRIVEYSKGYLVPDVFRSMPSDFHLWSYLNLNQTYFLL
jgi:hypothetical protein